MNACRPYNARAYCDYMIGDVDRETLEAMLDTLPVEFSFIDENDAVRIFNKNGDRIFPRPKGVLGRKVQDCHPKKSLHKVQQIISEMKSGDRDVAEFWIDHKGMKVHIRYFRIDARARQPFSEHLQLVHRTLWVVCHSSQPSSANQKGLRARTLGHLHL